MSKAKNKTPMRCRLCGSLYTELTEGVCIPCTAQGDAAQRAQQYIRESEPMAGIGCVTSRQGAGRRRAGVGEF